MSSLPPLDSGGSMKNPILGNNQDSYNFITKNHNDPMEALDDLRDFYKDYSRITSILTSKLGFVDAELNPEPLMNVFKQMIKFQLQAENERIMGLRPSTHDYDAKYTKLRTIPWD